MEKLTVVKNGWRVELLENGSAYDYTVTNPDGKTVDEGQVIDSDNIRDAMCDTLEGIEELESIAGDFDEYIEE